MRSWPLLALMLSACAPADPQATARVCYRLDGERRIEIGRDVPNMESCAAQLEAARMTRGLAAVEGLYQGHFIFADQTMITASWKRDGPRSRLFEDSAREQIRQAIQLLTIEGPQ